ncbi:MAG TPA: alpha-1,4-glucan--maltose-1-phosphate maltosyltransferase [Stellaceae bacterium]|jgi:starch synthase (maltosyl-transferring)|nr:alpha-1,4-glucan--maltose-1-phosphate maltosyltransferase [Stellaceae bacterium]
MVRTLNPSSTTQATSKPGVALATSAKSGATNATAAPASGARVVIERVYPELDGGRYAIKRVVGDRLEIWADIFRDGHDVLGANILYRPEGASRWHAAPMRFFDNDRWTGTVELTENRRYRYTIEAWTDLYASWCDRMQRKRTAQQDLSADMPEGRALVRAAEARAGRTIAAPDAGIDVLLGSAVVDAMKEWGPREDVTRLDRELEVFVDRKAATFASWYEMFPRSQGTVPGRGATFRDCIARLDDIAAMGFDTVYLPPIHPIGEKNRKGRNNSVHAEPGEPGSPYAIGSALGGHNAIHPELGTLDDFRAFIAACAERGMEVAIDLAVQCAPDHPWIKQHPEWFEFRDDGSIRYAENPPKLYQDIVNVNFRSAAWQSLWQAIHDIVTFWIDQGVRVFRVDNPHTKPFPFWEWLIRDVQSARPDILFLSEAFTRPKVMYNLAKLGFTQSYTYFTWRNEKQELIDYFVELTRDEPKEFLRPHLFTNTPDILPRFLQDGGAPAFRIRAVLGATLGGLFGIYNGFELCENRALPNSEEYADSEKYEYKVWDWDRPGNIKPLITVLNRIRRAHKVFEDWCNIDFPPCDNDRVLFYSRGNTVFIAVSLDPFGAQETTLDLPLSALGMSESDDLQMTNLLTGGNGHWVGTRQRIRLEPDAPALIFTVEKRR